MTLTRTSIILISLCVGSLAALLTYRYLLKERARAAQLTQPITVVVATRPIAARTVIEPTAVREKSLPAAMLPANCATSTSEVIGQVAVSSLMEDEPVSRGAVSPRTALLGMAYAVPAGQRAVAVALDPIIGVAGFLKPGDRVDVVATFTLNELKVTKTVLQDVTLLAIGPNIRPEEESKLAVNKNTRPQEQANATLAVTPTQAERLILAEADGKLRLTLRPADDRTIVSLTGIRSDALIGSQPYALTRASTAPPKRQNPMAVAVNKTWSPPVMTYKPPAPRPQAAPKNTREDRTFSVETIRGAQKTTVDVNAN